MDAICMDLLAQHMASNIHLKGLKNPAKEPISYCDLQFSGDSIDFQIIRRQKLDSIDYHE